MNHSMGSQHACHLAGCATEAHHDRCALLMRLKIREHDPQRDVGHVGPERVGVLVLGRPRWWNAVVEVALIPCVVRAT